MVSHLDPRSLPAGRASAAAVGPARDQAAGLAGGPTGHARAAARDRRGPRALAPAARPTAGSLRQALDDAADDDPEARRPLAGDAALRRDHAPGRRSDDPTLDLLSKERPSSSGRVPAQTLYLRRYPEGHAGRAALGHVGEISPDQLKQPRFRGVPQGTVVGKSGIERAYDRYLRGRGSTSSGRRAGATSDELSGAREPRSWPPDQALARPRPAAGRPEGAAAGDRARQRQPPGGAPARSSP